MATDRRQAIDAALTAPFAHQGLDVQYTTYVLRGDTPGAPRVVLSLEAGLPVAAARRPEPADVVFVVRDVGDGRVVASGTDVIALPAGTTLGSTTGRATYHVQFDIAPGDYLMRAIVREPGGQIGSADRRFHVRPMSGPGVSVSDLILGSQPERLPVRATAFTNDGLRGVLELYGTPAALGEVDVGLRLTAVGATDASTSIRADLLDIVRTERGASRAAQMELPLEAVAAGRYVAQVDVTRSGERIGQFRRELEVITGTSPTREADPVTTVSASEILRGQLAARYLTALHGATEDERLTAALELAGRDDWTQVGALVGPPGPEASLVHQALVGLARFASADYPGATSVLESAFETDTGRTAPCVDGVLSRVVLCVSRRRSASRQHVAPRRLPGCGARARPSRARRGLRPLVTTGAGGAGPADRSDGAARFSRVARPAGPADAGTLDGPPEGSRRQQAGATGLSTEASAKAGDAPFTATDATAFRPACDPR